MKKIITLLGLLYFSSSLFAKDINADEADNYTISNLELSQNFDFSNEGNIGSVNKDYRSNEFSFIFGLHLKYQF